MAIKEKMEDRSIDFVDISMFVRLSNLFDGLNNVSVCRIIAHKYLSFYIDRDAVNAIGVM